MPQENPYGIKIQVYNMGEDMAFHIKGGQAHIGASAIAYWNQGKIEVHVHELPHHKEGNLSMECAALAAKKLKKTCSVLMGIHIEHATKEQIEAIVNYVRKSMIETLEVL